MFWGLIMEPNKRYTQVVEKPFHISQAAMDISTGDNEPCQVMVVVDNKNFLVCTLRKKECVQQPLGLYFKQGDRVAFLTNGKCNIHLTGYLDPDYETDEGDEEEADDEEEELVDVAPAKNKRKLENGAEDVTSKKAKTGKKNKKAAADSSDSEDDDEDQLQRFLDGEEMDTDDNDDSFKVNTSGEADDSDEDEDDDDEEEDEAEEDDDEEEEEKPKKVDKKNKKTSSSAEEADTTLDTSKEDTEVDMSKLSKSQRRRLKKKLQQQNKQPQVNGVAKKEEAKKPEAKKAEAKKESPETPSADKKEKKQLSGGVNIEDLKVGTGPVAKPGKVVMVYYEGRLKQNNKMFDNCLKGPGFKFRLGSKEVISGWDVGIAGMKVGGKRKIVCPPAMAYGAKGSPPVIPPNSTLVFEVELKNVK